MIGGENHIKQHASQDQETKIRQPIHLQYGTYSKQRNILKGFRVHSFTDLFLMNAAAVTAQTGLDHPIALQALISDKALSD